jgi:uncharacterized protein
MKNAIILHGTLGSPDGNWFRWLKTELEQLGMDVWLPELPNAQQPSLKEWQEFVQNECPFVMNEDTLIVGHSSGAILAIILAQASTQKIGAIVDVSVFHDNSLQWEPNSRLFDVPFDWVAIKNSVDKLVFIHSDTDPYVPLDQAQFVADKTSAEMIVIPGQGHFNLEQNESYKQFPQLLKILKDKRLVG